MKARLALIAALAALAPAAPARAQWVANGDSLCTAANEQSNAVATSDNLGGAVVAWRDRRSSTHDDIYARAITVSGAAKWSATGVPICAAAGNQSNVAIATDAAGGAILVWEDERKSSVSPAIYAQRIRASGVVAWSANGVPIDTTAGYQINPRIVADGSGGAIIAWEASRGGRAQIHAQRVDSTGAVQWSANGVPVAATLTEQIEVEMVADGSGGGLLAWYDARETAGGYWAIYCGRITPSGTTHPSWPAGGVRVCASTQNPVYPILAPNDSGGVVVLWPDDRNYLSSGTDVYAQRVSATGVVRWATDGVPVCTATGDQLSPEGVPDGVGGALVGWEDQRAGVSNTTMYGQRLLYDGTRAWAPANGVLLCTASGRRTALRMVADGAGGAIATWQDYRAGVPTDIYAQRVTGSGSLSWNPLAVAICTAGNNQQLPVPVSDLAGGAIIAWHDNRTTSYDIYAQRVTASGDVAPTTNVVLGLPGAFLLRAPRPNPSRGGVAFGFELGAPAPVEAAIFDLAGRRVRSLAAGEWRGAGAHLLNWDGRDGGGAPAAAGLYFVRVSAGGASAEVRVVRVR